MKIKFFRKDIKMPSKSHLPDVGLDLYLPEDVDINCLETLTVSLGLGFQIPEGHAGMLVPRSSIAETGLIIQTAIIDPDYTGEIHLIATNASNKTIHLKKDQRVCSLVVYSVLNARLEIVNEFEKTERNDDCLGSSGM